MDLYKGISYAYMNEQKIKQKEKQNKARQDKTRQNRNQGTEKMKYKRKTSADVTVKISIRWRMCDTI